MTVIEFFGLPGAGKTAVAEALFTALPTQPVMRSKILADAQPATHRHLRRGKLIISAFLRRPMSMIDVTRLVLASRQKSFRSLLKTCWNFWSVLGFYLRPGNRREQVINDQGVLQAIWSVRLSGRSNSPDWWGFLHRHNLIPTFLVVITCPDELAVQRLAEREHFVSRLTGLSIDDPEWRRGREIFADITDEAEMRMPVIRIENSGQESIEQLVKHVVSSIFPYYDDKKAQPA